MNLITVFATLVPIFVTGTPVSKYYDPHQQFIDIHIPEWEMQIGSSNVNDSSLGSQKITKDAEDVWRVKLGDLCQITRFPLPSGHPARYLDCIKPFDDEQQWPWSDKGVWILKQCPPGQEFHLISHSCRSRRFIRRQQSMCNMNSNSQNCPQPQQQQYSVQQSQSQMQCQCPPSVSLCACPQSQSQQQQQQSYQPMPQQQTAGGGGMNQMCITISISCPQPPQPCPMASQGASNAQAGEVCSWMLAPLASDPQSNKCFLQCVPAPGNAYCGRWVRMPCAPGTIFDVNVQVCVHDPYNTPGQVPQGGGGGGGMCQTGTPIGQCNMNMQCPGQSTCQTSQQCQQQQQQPQQSQQCSVCCYISMGGSGASGSGSNMGGYGSSGGGGMMMGGQSGGTMGMGFGGYGAGPMQAGYGSMGMGMGGAMPMRNSMPMMMPGGGGMDPHAAHPGHPQHHGRK